MLWQSHWHKFLSYTKIYFLLIFIVQLFAFARSQNTYVRNYVPRLRPPPKIKFPLITFYCVARAAVQPHAGQGWIGSNKFNVSKWLIAINFFSFKRNQPDQTYWSGQKRSSDASFLTQSSETKHLAWNREKRVWLSTQNLFA